MSKYIATAVQQVSVVERVMSALRYGPLTPMQISQRIGVKSSNISAACTKNPDIFERITENKIGQKKPVYLWKLKNQ